MAQLRPVLEHARRTHEGFTLELSRPAEGLRLESLGGWTSWQRPHARYRLDGLGRAYRTSGRRVRALSPRREAVLLAALGRRMDRLAYAIGPTYALPGLAHALAIGSRYGPEQAERRRRRAHQAWPTGVAVLPPHRIRDLVLRIADGCPNAACSFCRFYRDQRFAPLSAPDLAAHLEHVIAARPDALQARGVFLGEASAASLPDGPLRAALEVIQARLGRPPRAMAAFLDPDHAPERSPAVWRAVADAGLVDLTVGLESGEGALRARVGKSNDLERVRRRLEAAWEGGLSCSLCVIAGLGAAYPAGRDALEAEARHREATAALLRRWELPATVRVYVAGLDAPPRPAVARQEVHAFARLLADATKARILPYGVERFHAWA